MSDATLRFFSIEHILYMVIAVVLGHVGHALSKKANEAATKHRMAAILFGLATLAILIAIPWSRPLFRFG
jgi:hypothetical protein